MNNTSTILTVIIGFSMLGSFYYYTETNQEEMRTADKKEEQEYRALVLKSQQQMQTDMSLIRRAVAPTNAEIQESLKELSPATSLSPQSYQDMIEERQKKVDEINNAIFQLHQ